MNIKSLSVKLVQNRLFLILFYEITNGNIPHRSMQHADDEESFLNVCEALKMGAMGNGDVIQRDMNKDTSLDPGKEDMDGSD